MVEKFEVEIERKINYDAIEKSSKNLKVSRKSSTRSTADSIGSRPSDHYFRSVCLSVCLFVCAELFSAVFDSISIKLRHMLYVWV